MPPRSKSHPRAQPSKSKHRSLRNHSPRTYRGLQEELIKKVDYLDRETTNAFNRFVQGRWDPNGLLGQIIELELRRIEALELQIERMDEALKRLGFFVVSTENKISGPEKELLNTIIDTQRTVKYKVEPRSKFPENITPQYPELPEDLAPRFSPKNVR